MVLTAPCKTDVLCQTEPIYIYIYIEHWWEQNIFCLLTTLQAFRQSSAPGALSTLVTSVVLYYLTRATHWWVLDGKDETHVCGYICSEFIHWTLWRKLMMRAEYLFVHHTTRILAKLCTWCFEHSGDISCSLLLNPSHTDESWERQNTCMWTYMLWIHSLSTLENTDESKIFFVRSPHCKHFGKAQHLVLCWALWWHQISHSLLINPSHTDESWEGQNTCLWINIYIYIYI